MKELKISARVALVLIITLILPALKPSFAFDDGDFQYWNTESVTWKVYEDWKANLEEEFRFGGNAGTLYYQHSDIGITYSGLAKWIDLAVSFREAFDIKKDRWKYEHQPNANATLKYELCGFEVSDRSKVEYRIREDEDDNWRYRNKFTVKSPKFTQLELQPYIADEIFYDFNEGALNRNRLFAGVSLKLYKNFKGEIYYLWQSSKKNKDWIDCNVLGTKIKLSF